MSLKSISREGGGCFSWGGEVLETWPSLSVIKSVKARMCEPVWVHWVGTVFVFLVVRACVFVAFGREGGVKSSSNSGSVHSSENLT